MSSFRMQFYLEKQNRYMRVTALEDRVFAIHLDDLESDTTSPEQSAGQISKAPDWLLQRTNTGNWTILEEGDITLNAEDLKRLGRRIEVELPFRV